MKADFYNEGFGWICRNCEVRPADNADSEPPRLFVEGEAESKSPRFSATPRAQWLDRSAGTLFCPACGRTGSVVSQTGLKQ